MLAWLLTYLWHSTIALGIVWLVCRLLVRHPAVREVLWKMALVAGLVTASLQVGLGVEPAIGRVALEAPAAATAPVAEVSPELVLLALADESSGPAVATPQPPSGFPWHILVGVLWAVGALFLLLALGIAWRRFRALLHGRRPLTEGSAAALLEELRGELRVPRPVRLSVAPRLESPVAMGWLRPEICLPERALRELDEACLRALLAHELAHLARRDPTWRLAGSVLARALFFQPLNRLALSRLEACAEYLCDARAARAVGRATTVAECLTEVAGWQLEGAAEVPASAMAGERARLGERVGELLAGGPTPRRIVLGGAAAAGLLALVIVVAVAPGAHSGQPPTPAPPAAPPPAKAPATPPAAKAPAAAAAPQTSTPPAKAAKRPDDIELKDLVEEALKHVPDAAELRKHVGKALEAVPDAKTLGKLVDKALAAIPDRKELRKHLGKALESVPDAKELRKQLDEAMKSVPDRKALQKQIDEAMKSIPSRKELSKQIDEAMKSIPGRKELQRQIDEALKSIPSGKELRELVKKSLEGVPSGKELKQMVEELLDGK